MMTVTHYVAVLCVLVTALALAESYVLKRADLYDEGGDNRLADALQVIARERRRLKEAERSLYNDYYWDDADAPETRSPIYDMPVSPNYESEAFLRDLFEEDDGGSEEGGMPENIDPRIFQDDVQEEPEENRSEEVPADDSELQDIFDGDDIKEDEKKQEEEEAEADKEEQKRTIPWQMGGTGGLPDKPDKKNEGAADVEPNVAKLSTEEVAKLLIDAEDIEEENLDNSSDDAEQEAQETAAEPVSEEELQDVLQDDGRSVAEQDTPDVVEDSGNSLDQVEYQDIPEMSKEWLLNQYLQQPTDELSSSKKKRSGDNVLPYEVLQEYKMKENPMQLSYKEDEVIVQRMEECLKHFIDLEDEENTKLAQALSLATLGQVERTEEYIPQEVKYLKGAVEDEENIKKMRQCLELGAEARGSKVPLKRSGGEAPIMEEEDIPLEEEEEEAYQQREDPLLSEEQMEEIPEQTQESDFRDLLAEKLKQYLLRTAASRPDMENAVEPGIIDNTGGDEEDILLNPFYRELYEQYARERGLIKRNNEDGEGFGPIDEDDSEEEVYENEAPEKSDPEQYIRNELQYYIAEMSPEERQELREEVAEALGEIAAEEEIDDSMCPAVDLYSDNCAYARQLGLELDGEAIDLCNRHQMCYSCGGSFGMSYKDCDKGFLETADSLCDGDEDCNDEAAGLFVVMVRGHTYMSPSEVDSQCEAQCVLDYIIGPDGDNL